MNRFLITSYWSLIVLVAVTNANPTGGGTSGIRSDDGIVEQWQTISLQPWPLQSSPIALTAALPFQRIQSNNLVLYNTAYYQQPTSFVNYPFTLFPSPLQPSKSAVSAVNAVNAVNANKPSKITTKKPKIRDIEPTTARSTISNRNAIPARLEEFETNQADFKNDQELLDAVSRINPEFVIEDIIAVPGKHVLSIGGNAPVKTTTMLNSKNTQKRIPSKLKTKQKTNSNVIVEATGNTATKGTIPQIPFGTYFLPYFAHAQSTNPSSKTAALILEPHSKAIVGNGGTAVSTPISRALLKRGMPTNVYFNPESVAIAGVGGKAHAQADLELDLIN